MRKIISIYLLFLFATIASISLVAQSRQEFEYGKELYNESKYKEALPYLQPTAKRGDAEAQHLVGWCFLYEGDATIALNMWHRAAEQDYAPALASLGQIYLSSRVTTNPSKAIAYYQKALALGSKEACLGLVKIYLEGKYVPKDEIKAFKLCHEEVADVTLAEWDPHVSSLKNLLGQMHLLGIGTEVNHKAALDIYESNLSPFGLDSLALVSMARMYDEGTVCKADPIKAVEFVERLLELNYAPPADWVDKIKASALEERKRLDHLAKLAAAQNDNTVYQKVEIMPEFPGGNAAMIDFLSKNRTYPKTAHDAGIEGRVIVKFTVSKDGRVVNPTIIKGVDASLDNETLRVLKLMPRWKPGLSQGVPVNVSLTTSFLFRLTE